MRVYTGLGHHCGVIPYSSVVWWIASWAEDEQLQGKNNLLRRGALVLGEFVWMRSSVGSDPSPYYGGGWSYLYRPWSSYQISSGKGSNNGQF